MMNTTKIKNTLTTVRTAFATYLRADFYFQGLLIYYWSFLYIIFPGISIARFSFLYFAYILPVLFFILLFRKSIFQNWKPHTILLFILILVISVVSIFRHDFMSVFSICLFVLTIIVISNSNQKVSLNLINGLFLISIILSIVTYHLGYKEYPYLPDFTTGKDLLSGIGWRISLFRSRPESGIFALYVLVANTLFNTRKIKYLLQALAFYFIIFSGYRTTLFLLAFFIVLQVITKIFSFKGRILYKLSGFIIIILVFFLVLFKSSWLRTIYPGNNKFLTELFLKSKSVYSDDEASKKSLSRDVLWNQHLSIFLKNPVFGVGSDKVQETFINKDFSGSTSGSESLLTRLLASYGLIVSSFIIYLYFIQENAVEKGNFFSYYVVLIILVSSLFYGSYLVPYNFIFLLLFCSLDGLKESIN